METEKKSRIESLDAVKGLIILIMTLDHVRDFFHAGAFVYDPVDLERTSSMVFFTRWITHFCAPAFCFLAGVSAYLFGARKKTQALSVFLLKRGAWLILLELTIINFGWYFDIYYRSVDLNVIWSLGISMIFLAALVYLPTQVIMVISCIIIFGHNLLDGIHFDGNLIWSIIHESRPFYFGHTRIEIIYPIVPWIGVMGLGYCFGCFYNKWYDPDLRKRILKIVGLSAIGCFLLLRVTNIYGDTNKWILFEDPAKTIMSFFNLSKYPASLLFLLMTLGPLLFVLSRAEHWKGFVANALVVFGKVPFFYFILHIYIVHLFAMLLFSLSGFGGYRMILSSWTFKNPNLEGYGYNLLVTYLMWVMVVLLLYPVCKWYGLYKGSNPQKLWLQYI
jgi:uncharacterized membrane protein